MSASPALVPDLLARAAPKRSPKLRPVRPSAQETGYHCGLSPTLGERFRAGSGVATSGTIDHALMAEAFRLNVAPKKPMLARMYDIIRSEWPDATWEVEVPIDIFDPESGERLIPEGTGAIDLLGTLPSKRLIVLDYKFGQRVVPHPDENRQIKNCYGYGIATMRDAPAFMPVVYQPYVSGMVQGRWYEDGPAYWAILEELKTAATLDPEEPVLGPWCDGCYSRTPHCREFATHAVAGETALAKFDAADIGSWNDDQVVQLLMMLDALEERAKDVRAAIKDEARRRDGLKSGGKVYGPVPVRGRRSIAIERVKEAGLYEQLEAAGCVSGGGYGERFTWRNIKATGEAEE